MTFVYPAIFKQEQDGSWSGRFPDLEMCEFKGRDLQSALDDARSSMHEWIRLELEEEDEPDLPAASDEASISLAPGEELRRISTHYRFTEGWEE